MNYREARIQDLGRLLELEQEVVSAERPFNSSIKVSGVVYYDLRQLISSASSKLLVAEHHSSIFATGYIKIEQSKQSFVHTQHGYIGFVYVSPEQRGQGVAQQILQKLMEWGRQQGVSDFYLDVYSQNEAAVKAYRKLGFLPNLLEMKLSV